MATQSAVFEDRTVSIGRVFGRAFAVAGGDPLVVFGLAFVLYAVPSVAYMQLVLRLQQQVIGTDALVQTIAYQLAGLLVRLILSVLVHGALVQTTLAHVAGRRAGIVETIASGLHAVLPLLAMSLLAGVGIVLGVVVAIIPGVMLWVMWAVAAPALVAERIGPVRALKRSMALTRGVRRRVLGLELIVLVVSWLASGIVTVLVVTMIHRDAMSGQAFASLPLLALRAAVATLIIGLGSTISAALYVELRDWHDGPPRDRLADIFG